MPRFEILANTTVIGHSELEGGDPPMGGAIGKFVPLSTYKAIQHMVIATRDDSQAHLALSVRTSEGRPIPAQSGVQIVDFSPELGPEGIQVHVWGIGYPLYEELFPGRHAEYVAHCRNVLDASRKKKEQRFSLSTIQAVMKKFLKTF